MSWKSLTVLAILAAGLGGFLVVDSYWLTPKREKAASAKGRLWTIEPKDVEALTIKRKDDTISLKRAGDGWEMLEPVRTRASSGAVNEMVTALATARVDREIDPNPSKPADFGLDPPEASVTLEVKGQAAPLTLAVGGKNPTGVWVYAREGSKPAVIVIGDSISRDVTRPAADYRDRTLFAFDRRNVSSVDLDLDGSKMTLEAEEGGKWRIAKPGPYRADAEMITEVLDKFASSTVSEFLGSAKPPSAYGLDKPSRVTLWLGKDKDRTSKTLLLGKVDTAKKGVYVQRQGEEEVLLAPAETWDRLPKSVAAARDKVVFAYAYDKVNRVDIESASGTVTLQREGTDWRITAPEALKADSGAVNGLLWRIRDLRASGFLDDSAAGVARYLPKPDVTVKVWEEGVKEPKTLLLALSNTIKVGEPTGVAAPTAQGPVFMVEAKDVRDFPRAATDLRDKSVVASFDMKDVKRVRLSVGDKRLLLERRGEDEWRVVEPSKGPAKEIKVTGLLLTLRALKWKEITAADGADAARFGLDKPEGEIVVLKSDGKEMAGLTIGRTDPKLSYVRSKSSPAIYAVDPKLLEDIRKAPSEIPG
jgi:uncharacterized protein DUF4340